MARPRHHRRRRSHLGRLLLRSRILENTQCAEPSHHRPSLSLAILPCWGCGGGGTPHLGKTVPVKGRITYRGKPLVQGTVTFEPEDTGREASGDIGPDGTFVLTTFTDGDGAVPGIHRVRVGNAAVGPATIGRPAATKNRNPRDAIVTVDVVEGKTEYDDRPQVSRTNEEAVDVPSRTRPGDRVAGPRADRDVDLGTSGQGDGIAVEPVTFPAPFLEAAGLGGPRPSTWTASWKPRPSSRSATAVCSWSPTTRRCRSA